MGKSTKTINNQAKNSMLLGLAAIVYTHKPNDKKEDRKLWLTGLGCGVFLCIASNLQQVALNTGVAPGKAGFLKTALSVREIIGCALMFLAICLAQINFNKKSSKE